MLTQQQWELLTGAVEQWEENVLQPYRRLRRIAKVHLDSEEYQKMLDVELIMERKSQYMLLHKLNLLQRTTLDSLFGLDVSIMAELTTQAGLTNS